MAAFSKDSILTELQEMKQRMDEIYSDSFKDKNVYAEDSQAEPDVWQPLVDILETSTEWLFIADLPGVGDSDLQVEIMDGQLRIGGRRETIPPGKEFRLAHIERPEGRFSRTFVLPRSAQKEAIRAELKKGVLTVTIPKAEPSQSAPHRIAVRSE